MRARGTATGRQQGEGAAPGASAPSQTQERVLTAPAEGPSPLLRASPRRRRKAERHTRILELIASHVVDSQEALVVLLQAEGFAVTQATVSRDIHELRLVKVPAATGGYRYAAPTQSAYPVLSEQMLRLFRECVVGVDDSENLVVLHTLPATAMGVAEVVDNLLLPEVVGTLAGERTVFVVIKPRAAVRHFVARVRQMTGLGDGPGRGAMPTPR